VKPLTPKQSVFVQEYLIDLNATQAAIRAGYSKKTAMEQGCRLFSNVKVKEAIQAGMDKRAERTDITADYVLGTIRNTVERCQGGDDDRYEPAAVLRGCELLGKHLELFTDKIKHGGRVMVGDMEDDEQRFRRLQSLKQEFEDTGKV